MVNVVFDGAPFLAADDVNEQEQEVADDDGEPPLDIERMTLWIHRISSFLKVIAVVDCLFLYHHASNESFYEDLWWLRWSTATAMCLVIGLFVFHFIRGPDVDGLNREWAYLEWLFYKAFSCLNFITGCILYYMGHSEGAISAFIAFHVFRSLQKYGCHDIEELSHDEDFPYNL